VTPERSAQAGPSPIPSESRRLFDIAGAVEYLRGLGATTTTKNFLRGLICTGQLPRLRIGKAFYVSREALDSWLAKHERRAQ
jgi:hypothetical protein